MPKNPFAVRTGCKPMRSNKLPRTTQSRARGLGIFYDFFSIVPPVQIWFKIVDLRGGCCLRIARLITQQGSQSFRCEALSAAVQDAVASLRAQPQALSESADLPACSRT